MSRILIYHAPARGQAERVADFLGNELRAVGATVDQVVAGKGAPDAASHAGIIVIGTAHFGYSREMTKWVRREAHALQRRPAVFLTVCLGVLNPDSWVQRNLVRVRQRFMSQTGWRPARAAFVAGAVRYRRHQLLRRHLLRWIAGQAGASQDTSRDHEYTDWQELRHFAASFARECGVRPPRGPTGPRPVPERRPGRTVAWTGVI